MAEAAPSTLALLHGMRQQLRPVGAGALDGAETTLHFAAILDALALRRGIWSAHPLAQVGRRPYCPSPRMDSRLRVIRGNY